MNEIAIGGATVSREDLQKWVNALRSGEYKQTRLTLQDDKGYCCLGVACLLFIPKEQQAFNSFGYLYGQMPNHQTYAPKWLIAITKDVMDVKGVHIPTLNDKGTTFEEIANLIEETYLK